MTMQKDPTYRSHCTLRCCKANGCLQVLSGSHRLGRIDHVTFGKQAKADPERLEEAKKAFELVHVEMEPGDALFFHCNLLHTRQGLTIGPIFSTILLETCPVSTAIRITATCADTS